MVLTRDIQNKLSTNGVAAIFLSTPCKTSQLMASIVTERNRSLCQLVVSLGPCRRREAEHFNYAEGWDHEAIELPYDGRELSMVIFIPHEGHFEAFERSFTTEKVDNVLAELSYTNVSLTMPKFTFEFALGLSRILAEMGMPDAFDSRVADFSGMDGSRSLFISKVLHKAFIALDEEGTEAAAATAVVMDRTAAPQEPIEVLVDRPFVFIIGDLETRTILFVGRVLNPEV